MYGTVASAEWERDGYIGGPKFPHLVDRQREPFSLYQPIKLDPTFDQCLFQHIVLHEISSIDDQMRQKCM